MGMWAKIVVMLAGGVVLVVIGMCGWLFIYSGDLPDISHLSRFDPAAESELSDSCLDTATVAIPSDQMGKTLRDALTSAELPSSLPTQIATTLLCNSESRSFRYMVNVLRLSWRIKRRFSEQQILTIYANRAYFGSETTGVKNASAKFFDNRPDALKPEEAALLAGLLRAPNRFSPFEHADLAFQRRNSVLQAMATAGKVSIFEAARAEATPIIPFERLRAKTPLDAVAAKAPAQLAGQYTSASEELRKRVGPFLSGRDLYLFPDGTYIYCEWADIEPITVNDKGTWALVADRVVLTSDRDISWKPHIDREYVAVRRPFQCDEVLLVGTDYELSYFEKEAERDPVLMLLIVGKKRVKPLNQVESSKLRQRLMQSAWRPKYFETPG